MDSVAAFFHVEAGGFYAGSSVRSGNKKFSDFVLLNKCGEVLACQGVAFCLDENVVGSDFHFRHKFRSMRSGLERPCSGGKIVILDINNVHSACHRPVNRLIHTSDYFHVIFCDVILKVNHDQRDIFHFLFLLKNITGNIPFCHADL